MLTHFKINFKQKLFAYYFLFAAQKLLFAIMLTRCWTLEGPYLDTHAGHSFRVDSLQFSHSAWKVRAFPIWGRCKLEHGLFLPDFLSLDLDLDEEDELELRELPLELLELDLELPLELLEDDLPRRFRLGLPRSSFFEREAPEGRFFSGEVSVSDEDEELELRFDGICKWLNYR